MKIILAMDSYKGCMTAAQCVSIVSRALHDVIPSVETGSFPMADGGEGTVECLVDATKGRTEPTDVTGVFGEKMKGSYGILGDNSTAVVESACASGIQGIKKDKLDPLAASSFGTGQIIAEILKKGFRNVIIGFGGTATSDGGMGALSALSIRFYNKNNCLLAPSGRAMGQVDRIDDSQMMKEISGASFTFACDVENVYYGRTGAAYVFAPQKGADKNAVLELDAGLKNMSDKFIKCLGKDISSRKSAGAAGGLAGGLMTVCEPVIKSGFDVILSNTGLEKAISSCDLVITGEGKTDRQTLYGKLPYRVGLLSKKYGKPVICISGAVTEEAEALKDHGITALFSIANGPMTLEESIKNSQNLLYLQAKNIAGLISIM